MVRIKGRLSITTILLLLVSVSVLVLAQISCDSSQETTNPQPLGSADKGNPKLDSQLNQLVSAEMRGEAVQFAEQRNIELVNTGIRVIIECVPGQFDAAAEAATNVGGKLEASYENLLQLVVPITELNNLAGATSIHFIRLPQQPLPAVSLHDQMGSLIEGNFTTP